MTQRRIISKIDKTFRPKEHGFCTNPIAAHLSEYVADILAKRFREKAHVDDALVVADFSFEERDGEVVSMCLSFNVRSWGRDILEDVLFFRLFQRVVGSTISRRILLQHTPNNGFGLAEYHADDFYSMISLLEAIGRTGCDTKTTFAIAPDDFFNEQNGIVRIGFCGYGLETKLEVYVRTDDECCVPHFHVRDTFHTERDIPVALHGNNYYPHENDTRQLDDDELRYLAAFMSERCRSPKFANNYEFAVTMWNMNNNSQYRCDMGYDDNIIIPDYAHTSFIEKQVRALKQGLHVQFDNLYLARMNNEIKNRRWV